MPEMRSAGALTKMSLKDCRENWKENTKENSVLLLECLVTVNGSMPSKDAGPLVESEKALLLSSPSLSRTVIVNIGYTFLKPRRSTETWTKSTVLGVW